MNLNTEVNLIIITDKFFKVIFDNKNFIFVHPEYLKNIYSKSENFRLKYLLWSVGILILKYIFNTEVEDLVYLHKNHKYLKSNLINFQSEKHKIFFKLIFSYEDDNFTEFYKM